MLPSAEAGREIACLVHVVPSQVHVSGGIGGGPSIPAGRTTRRTTARGASWYAIVPNPGPTVGERLEGLGVGLAPVEVGLAPAEDPPQAARVRRAKLQA